ncbi:MBL fold metallo-hydrolase [Crassaminicella profunda]|uniref:MBL fold metallo-hydrolase n=1 Tax=Crassaminicella profunda TaxID=1286698 RepID=UPI001CA60A77|nr:MBL fold metallo-hydrolase [Crassaminicella profunda]QZY55160.1 MBL fold metallo-hydrolase [Crassaminicella profunda]
MGLTFCSLASGSSGNCQYIESSDSSLLIDAGLSGKRIQQAMESIGKDMEKVQGILITHEHNDHIKGVGILSRRFNIPIYANNNTWKEMKDKLGKVDEENIRYFDTGEEFFIEDIKIKPYSISHDAIEPVGFSFYHDHAKVSIVTDTGYVPETVKKEIQGSDVLLLESNHDVEMLKMGRYPWYLKKRVMGDEGHLSNETAGEIIAELVKLDMPINNVLLGHLSKENNFPELAFETVKNVLSSKDIKIGLDINVDLTYRDRVSSVYHIKK